MTQPWEKTSDTETSVCPSIGHPSCAVSAVTACLMATHANTLPLLACLRVCEIQRPYREAEARLVDDPVMRMSLQNAHVLIGLLVKAGGIATKKVDEGQPVEGRSGISADQPADYLVQTTEAGRSALRAFDPAQRFSQLVTEEPSGYGDVYAQVLDICAQGAARDEIEGALARHRALIYPKRIYPSYFISKLETIGGLSWDGMWRTTEAGICMRATVP